MGFTVHVCGNLATKILSNSLNPVLNYLYLFISIPKSLYIGQETTHITIPIDIQKYKPILGFRGPTYMSSILYIRICSLMYYVVLVLYSVVQCTAGCFWKATRKAYCAEYSYGYFIKYTSIYIYISHAYMIIQDLITYILVILNANCL